MVSLYTFIVSSNCSNEKLIKVKEATIDGCYIQYILLCASNDENALDQNNSK